MTFTLVYFLIFVRKRQVKNTNKFKLLNLKAKIKTNTHKRIKKLVHQNNNLEIATYCKKLSIENLKIIMLQYVRVVIRVLY
jgi:hypothetical protein